MTGFAGSRPTSSNVPSLSVRGFWPPHPTISALTAGRPVGSSMRPAQGLAAPQGDGRLDLGAGRRVHGQQAIGMQPRAARAAALDVAVGRLDVDVGGLGGLDQQVPRAGQYGDPERAVRAGHGRRLVAAVTGDRFLLEVGIARVPRPVLEDRPGDRAARRRLHDLAPDHDPARQGDVNRLAHSVGSTPPRRDGTRRVSPRADTPGLHDSRPSAR